VCCSEQFNINTYIAGFYAAGFHPANYHTSGEEPETEQTFTRREAKQYTKAIKQRTETKRRITKRKAHSLGEEVSSSC
jgi:hypothetical protein